MEEPTTLGRDGEFTTGHFRESDIEFLRAQAKEWLEAVLGEDLDDGSSLEDLLADGCLLYRVSQDIRDDMKFPSHVESVSNLAAASHSLEKKNSMKYQPYASVEAFLKVCKEVGLQDLDVFNPSDAVDKKDIRRVCVCLRRFSKKGRTLGIQVPDFDNVKDTLVTPSKMPRDVVQRTQESLQQSSSRSSRSGSAYGLVSSETSSLIANLREDDAEKHILKSREKDKTYNKVHHDLDVAAGYEKPVVMDSKYSVKVAEPGVNGLLLVGHNEEDGTTKKLNQLVLTRSGVDSTHGPAPKGAESVSQVYPFFVDDNGVEADTKSSTEFEDTLEIHSATEPMVKVAPETLVVEKKQVEPFRGLVVDKPMPKLLEAAVGEKANVKPSKPRHKGPFVAHLQDKEPYLKKEVKEIKKDDKNGSYPWLSFLGGAISVVGGITGLLFWKRRFGHDDNCDIEGHTAVKLYSGGLYRVSTGDNLTQIAKKFGKHWRDIADRNPSIDNPDLIYPGDFLKL